MWWKMMSDHVCDAAAATHQLKADHSSPARKFDKILPPAVSMLRDQIY